MKHCVTVFHLVLLSLLNLCPISHWLGIMGVCSIPVRSCYLCWIFVFCVWLFLPVGLPCCHCPVLLCRACLPVGLQCCCCCWYLCPVWLVLLYLYQLVLVRPVCCFLLTCFYYCPALSVISGFCGGGLIEIKFACSLSNFYCSCWKLTNCSCSFCWLLSASRKITCGLLNFAVLSFNLWIFLTALSILRVDLL